MTLHLEAPPLTRPTTAADSRPVRPRRLRRTPALRALVRETRLHPSMLVAPLFVQPGVGRRDPIESMPGQARISADLAAEQAARLAELGVGALELPLVTIADTCLCEYTDHGHCGPIAADGSVDNDAALVRLAETAVAQARAGADIVAPSAMMDGQVAAIRTALDAEGFDQTAIMAYASKHASAFYGPFREAVDSAPAFGDRRGYQMERLN